MVVHCVSVKVVYLRQMFRVPLLLRSAGIAGGRAVGGDSSGVCDVAAGGVVAAGAVGDLYILHTVHRLVLLVCLS